MLAILRRQDHIELITIELQDNLSAGEAMPPHEIKRFEASGKGLRIAMAVRPSAGTMVKLHRIAILN